MLKEKFYFIFKFAGSADSVYVQLGIVSLGPLDAKSFVSNMSSFWYTFSFGKNLTICKIKGESEQNGPNGKRRGQKWGMTIGNGKNGDQKSGTWDKRDMT